MKLKNWAPLWITIIVFWLVTFALLFAALKQTQGHFGYPIDDTYIHMAIAKHFVNDGFWGVSQTGFSSSTSSPLWTFLIAAVYKLFGVNEWAPVALSFLFGNLTIVLCFFLLRKKIPPLKLTIILLLIMFLIPLPVITLTAMEHTLHGFLTLWLVYLSSTLLSSKKIAKRQYFLMIVLSMTITITRYEGLFLIAVISFLFVITKRFGTGLLIGVSGFFPIAAYGLFSMSKGWYFLPNSVLIKGNMPSLSLKGMIDFLSQLINRFITAPHMLVLIVACAVLFLVGKKKFGKKEKYLTETILMISVLHMLFADIGWFYRYEAYLILTGYVILADASYSLISSNQKRTNSIAKKSLVFDFLLRFIVLITVAIRASFALQAYPIAVNNIFEQDYQLGIFISRYYTGKNVAINDIGAINFLSEIKAIDLYGLSNLEVAQARINGTYDKKMIAELVSSHNVDLVVLYPSDFIGRIPSEWKEVGRWKIANNVVCGSDTVAFYSTTYSSEIGLISNLKTFSTFLPSTIVQSGKYLNQ